VTPSYAYIPGQTPRHPDGAFDVLRDSVALGMSEAELAASEAMQAGLRFLNDGFYWESHEVLEPVWMVCAPQSAERSMVQSLIQLANARLKIQMNRINAALRLTSIATEHLAAASRHRDQVLGLAVADVADWIEETERFAKDAL